MSPTFTFAYLRCMMTYDVFGRNRTLQTEVEVPMHQTPCPITGKWGSWTPWTSCNADCGGGTKTRRRECNKPLPSNGGDHCEGHRNETAICNMQSCSTNPPPVDGGWSSWTPWTSCSADCGEGTKTRTRECNQPPPSDGGAFCRGSSDEKARCNMHPCSTVPPPVDGGWGSWKSWTACSVSCGGGTQTREKKCDNPRPDHGGSDCPGNAPSDSKQCNTNPCPCLDDNTAYYGYNIIIQKINGDSSTCQQMCQRRNGCNFWSFNKVFPNCTCYLKTSKAGEPKYTKIYGPVYKGNNNKYVSGSKYCTHVSNTYSSPFV